MLRPDLQEIVDDFVESPRNERLELLLDYADGLPALPERYVDNLEALERVTECQTPLYVGVELDAEGFVRLFFEAPPAAPTTRGYAGILAAGLDGATPAEVAATPTDVYVSMGLDEVITPLRLRGMGSILARIQQLVAAQAAG